MINLTRRTGTSFALNPDLIERVERSSAAAAVTLVDGTTYAVRESVSEVVDRIHRAQAAVVALSRRIDEPAPPPPHLRVVPGPAED